jgi:hypothetical protein
MYFDHEAKSSPRARHPPAIVAAVIALLLAGTGSALAIGGLEGGSKGKTARLARTTTDAKTVRPEHLESVVRYNSTDDDAQVLLLAKDEEHAFADVRVITPDGRTVFKANVRAGEVRQSVADVRTSQHRLAAIRRAFPPGEYRWRGRMLDGERIAGSSRLRYRLPQAPRIVSPADGASGVPVTAAEVEWQPVARAEAIFVEVEDDTDGGQELLLRLDGDATSIPIPDGFLKPETEYAVELKSMLANGNQAAADYTFVTG